MAKGKVGSGKYKFRKTDTIGANDAENDERFLAKCFEDTGELAALAKLDHPKRVVLGRTGSGKSALLLQLKRQKSIVISVEPESLSLNFIANSTIIRFLTDLGVNLDPFYKLLWRHVFSITLLQRRFDLHDEPTAKASMLSWLFESQASKEARQVESERRKKALKYLEQWGSSFWKDIDVRITEITNTFESQIQNRLEGSLGGSAEAELGPLKVALEGKGEKAKEEMKRLTTDQKTEIVHRAQQVVNEIQVKELTGMLDFLEDVLQESPFDLYIVIDRLDEGWVEEKLRYRLIKALLDTVREFGKIHKAKMIIALRIDLIEQVFQQTKADSGFQEEKYGSLYLPLKWTKPQLVSLLNRRIAELIKDQYQANYDPTCDEILPKGLVKGGSSVDYIIDRTWMRPRDVIDFFNACIKRADGQATFTKEIVTDAEGEYSQGRFKSLMYEWQGLHPCLETLTKELLTKRPQSFALSQFTDNQVDELCLQLAGDDSEPHPASTDPIFIVAQKRLAGTATHQQVRNACASTLYKTGIVGLKTQSTSAAKWADNESNSVSPSEITDATTIYCHPGLYRALGIELRAT